jgi:TonB family protein
LSVRRGPVLLALLLSACSREPPRDPAVQASVDAFAARRAEFQQEMRARIDAQTGKQRDFRGRTLREDLEHWVNTPESRTSIDALVERALDSHYPADAEQYLKQAEAELAATSEHSKAILEYWNGHLPAPYWRRYWNALFEANGARADAPDPLLVGIENRMTESLDRGDFAGAGRKAEELLPVFDAARERVVNRFAKELRDTAKFQARKTACAGAATRGGWNDHAKIVRGGSIDDFYPRQAIDSGEAGAVVLRARIDRTGCARSVAVVAHSGVPSLDDAALAWFETAQFSPATSGGQPIESDLVWKVRFVLKD